uniref:Uncharacterized protein n=2 Tax=Hucho hucho TaxID=62062 RepID=A0A4W5LX76_9TELE
MGDLAGVAPLPPLALHKAESVASVTSQCSFSSTIVFVGDKKPPESDIVMEDAPHTTTPATPTPIAIIARPSPPRITSPPRRRGGLTKGVGLTKEVLSAHTQQEEQAFLCRFSDLSQLRVFDPASALRCPLPTNNPLATGACCFRDYPAAGDSRSRRRDRGAKRLKQQESSEQRDPLALGITVTLRGPNFGPMDSPPISTYPLPLAMPLGPPTTTSSWPASVGSQASLASLPYPPGMLPIYPPLSQPMGIPSMQNQMVSPMMALVLPNYMFPQLNPNMTQMATTMGTPMGTAMNMMGSPMSQPGATVVTPSPQHFFNPNAVFPFPSTNGMPCPLPTMLSLMQTAMPIQAQRPASGSSTPPAV